MLRSNTYRQIYQSWRIRLNALPTLLVFFYRNLISISPDDASQVMDALVDCLADENVEVREMSSKVLSGIIRCSQRESIVPLKVSEPIAFVKDSWHDYRLTMLESLCKLDSKNQTSSKARPFVCKLVAITALCHPWAVCAHWKLPIFYRILDAAAYGG